MKEKPATLNRGVCFSLKWKATCKNWAHMDKEKKIGLKSHLSGYSTQPFSCKTSRGFMPLFLVWQRFSSHALCVSYAGLLKRRFIELGPGQIVDFLLHFLNSLTQWGVLSKLSFQLWWHLIRVLAQWQVQIFHNNLYYYYSSPKCRFISTTIHRHWGEL